MDLKNKDPLLLAVRCKEVSVDPSMDVVIADRAMQLVLEWSRLEARGQPIHYKENDQLLAEKQAHAIMMAEFLERYNLVK